MCGLVGLVSSSPRDAEELLRLVHAMQDQHRHRGPDGHGAWSDGRTALGHVRLAIHGDRVLGAQPLVDDTGARLIFNGEIYEPHRVLASLGLSYGSGESDGVALNAVLARRGPTGLAGISGMFAAARHDPADGSVTLVRDTWGQKPLYLRRWRDGWAFASTISALTVLGRLRLRQEAPLEYLMFRSVGGLHTAFDGIEQLAPGSWCRLFPDGRSDRGRYAHPPTGLSDRVAGKMVRHEIDAAIATRVSDTFANAVLLSGGADSSIVAASLHRQRPDASQTTFSIGYDAAGVEDETAHAQRLAEHLGLAHHRLSLAVDEVPDLLLDVARLTEDPIQDPVTLPTLKLARSISAVTKVALSGDGSDEFWGGYARFDDVPNSLADYLARSAVFTAADLGLPAAPLSYLDDIPVPDPTLPALDRVLRLEADNRLRNYHLARIDKLGMAQGLEIRSPFLDVRVSNLAQSLSAEVKRPGGRPKGLLLDAYAGDLPTWLVRRKKQPFSIPLIAWLSDGLRDYAHDRLMSSQTFTSAYLDPALHWKQFRSEPTGANAMRVWSLLQLEAWHDVWNRTLA